MINRLIIGLTGEIASGKTTVANIIKKDFGGEALKFSGPLRDILLRLGLSETRANMQDLSTILREHFGQDLLSRVLFSDVEKSSAPVIFIDGVRRMTDVEAFKNLPGFVLLYIEAPEELRYERITKRSENSDDGGKTMADFKRESESEAESMIKDLKKFASEVIDNTGSQEELHARVVDIMQKKKTS